MNETRPPLAKRATDLLAAEELDAAPPSPEDRARAIAKITAAIEAAARRRRRIRAFSIAAGVAAVAASIAVGVSFRGRRSQAVANPTSPQVPASSSTVAATGRALEGDAIAWHAGAQASLGATIPIDVGDRLVAPADARAALTLSTGTRIVIEGGSELDVVEQDATQIYALRAGSIRADVAKLGSGERFVVRTMDAEVEVRGTSFRLAVVPSDPSCGGGTSTRLYVDEGVVAIRENGAEDRVAAGEKWPRGCEVPAVAPSSSTTAIVAPPTASTATIASNTKPATTSASDLQAQNDLFASGVAEKHAGNLAGAIATFERLLAKYPAGPLSESATVERMRSLALLDPARGAVAAKAYLARYPHGFARAEAEGLAGP